MTVQQWDQLCALLLQAVTEIVADSSEGEEDEDAETLTSALQVAQDYRGGVNLHLSE